MKWVVLDDIKISTTYRIDEGKVATDFFSPTNCRKKIIVEGIFYRTGQVHSAPNVFFKIKHNSKIVQRDYPSNSVNPSMIVILGYKAYTIDF